ncbi:phage integrase central domain-containing protein [Microbulbifer sp. ANSA001]|uniref:phage integrase central domain-containing protein n=1 Tax=Microbulbifer sp. ANSA001 TaxID=3243358 RepID=UPI00404202CA
MRLLERDLFPYLGRRPIGKITPPELLTTLKRIEARGAIETAKRAKQTASQVFRFAMPVAKLSPHQRPSSSSRAHGLDSCQTSRQA